MASRVSGSCSGPKMAAGTGTSTGCPRAPATSTRSPAAEADPSPTQRFALGPLSRIALRERVPSEARRGRARVGGNDGRRDRESDEAEARPWGAGGVDEIAAVADGAHRV